MKHQVFLKMHGHRYERDFTPEQHHTNECALKEHIKMVVAMEGLCHGRSLSQRRPPGGCELQLMFMRRDLVQVERRAFWVENVLS